MEVEKGAGVTVSRLRPRDRELRVERLTYQLKVSRGVNSTTRSNAFLATTKVYIRARRRGVVIIFLHIIWLGHRALGIGSDFETWADGVLVAFGFQGKRPFMRTRGHDEVYYFLSFDCNGVDAQICLRSLSDVCAIEQAISNWRRS